MKYWLWLILSIASIPTAVPQTTPSPEPQPAFFGRIINVQTHEPVRRVAVKMRAGSQQFDELSDGEGHFQFRALPTGDYTLIAHRAGFTDRTYTVSLSDLERPREFTVELFPQGVIAGKVLDGFGQPLQGVHLQALRSGHVAGNIEAYGSAETNDLGEFRLSGLDPGTYRIRATHRDGRRSEFDATPLTTATSLYGGDKGTELAVSAGSITSGIDFVLNPVRPATIRGTVHTAAGAPINRATLSLIGLGGEDGHGGQSQNGEFAIPDINPGSYTITAETSDQTAPFFGTATVNVRGEDVSGIDLVLRPSPRIEGQIQVQGGDISSLKSAPLFFFGTDRTLGANLKMAKPDNDGTFRLALRPGEYLFSSSSQFEGFDVQKITVDGKPVTDWKLVIDSSAEPKKLVIVLTPKTRP